MVHFYKLKEIQNKHTTKLSTNTQRILQVLNNINYNFY